jgi:hypothetical protein
VALPLTASTEEFEDRLHKIQNLSFKGREKMGVDFGGR